MNFGMTEISKAEDPDDLICSNSYTLTRNSLKKESGKSNVGNQLYLENNLKNLIEDAYSFCCSFYINRERSNSSTD